MTEPPPIPVAQPVLTCISCFEKINEPDQFCQSCGYPLKGSEEEQKQFFYNRNYQQLMIGSLKKKIKSAGTTLYVLGVLFLIYSLFYFFRYREEDTASATIIAYAVVAIIFVLLAVWSDKKPVAAIISGMVLYLLLQILAAIDNPLNLFSGIIFKIIIITCLINGLNSGMEAERIKKQHNL